jgi:hypothetical protein
MGLMASSLALSTLFLLLVRKDNGQLCRVSSMFLLEMTPNFQQATIYCNLQGGRSTCFSDKLRACLAMLFKVTFCFLLKSKSINKQVITHNTQNYFYFYITSQLENKKRLQKDIVK